jgi:peptide chain release factor 1
MGQDFNKVEAMVTELDELEVKLSDPATHSNPNEARRIGKRHAELKPVVAKYREWLQLRDDEIAAREMGEEDAAFLAEAETMAVARETAAEKLQEMLIPRDPMDGNDVILEIKAGAGGEESALFAGDLMRMYLKFAEKRGWVTQVLEAEESDMGGYKDIAIAVKSKGVVAPEDAPFANLKFEGGVHRVQRVPVTESQGRIHTSAAGVLVLPEAEEVDVTIDPNDLRIDVFRSSGPGGQSVNTTDSAVRITHVPTGIVVSCQNERSQIQNKATAMAVLQSKLLERRNAQERAKIDALRGDTSGSWGNQIRSYVLHPYQMVKDHRTDFETGNTQAVLDGDLDGFISSGIRWRRERK